MPDPPSSSVYHFAGRIAGSRHEHCCFPGHPLPTLSPMDRSGREERAFEQTEWRMLERPEPPAGEG